jgi:hypothetical protein
MRGLLVCVENADARLEQESPQDGFIARPL